jgi:hypothetical protein
MAASVVCAFFYAAGPAAAATEAEKVAAQLEQIYDATRNSQDREIVAAASVISTLIGALLSHRPLELSDFVLPFSQSEVDRLQSDIKRRRGIRRPARRVAEKSNVLDEMRLHYGGLTPSQKRGERYFTNFLAPRWYPRVRSEVAPKRRGGI